MTQHLVRSFQKGLLPKCRGSLGAGKCTVDPSIQQLRPQPLFLCFLALPLPLLWQFEHLLGGAGTGFYFSGFEEPASAPTHRHRAPSAFGRRSSIAFYVEIRFLLLLWGMGSNIGECNFKTSKKNRPSVYLCLGVCGSVLLQRWSWSFLNCPCLCCCASKAPPHHAPPAVWCSL